MRAFLFLLFLSNLVLASLPDGDTALIPENYRDYPLWQGEIPRDLPPSMDWRNVAGLNYVSGVRNQGACGSCWGFAALAMFESRLMIQSDMPGSDPDYSEQYVLSCYNVAEAPSDCGGGYLSGALQFLRDEGAPSEDCFPYEADDSVPCAESCDESDFQIRMLSDFGFVTWNNIDIDLIKSVLQEAPVATWFRIYDNFNDYDGGVYSAHGSEYTGSNHFVLIVGYDDYQQCWIAKNSWGSWWGMNGYFRIAYDSGCEFGKWTMYCSFETSTSAPGIETGSLEAWPNPFNPSVRISFELDSSCDTRVSIHDVSGRKLKTLQQGFLPAGRHSFDWEGRSEAGIDLPSGLYFARLQTGNRSHACKLSLMK